MKDLSTIIWKQVSAGIETKTRKALDAALAVADKPVRVFFRADDIGVPGRSFHRLMDIFRRHRAPLCLALVPAWVTPARWKALDAAGKGSRQWCWHQHGWRHVNHELFGKKQEFGSTRGKSAVRADVQAGFTKLQSILGETFDPFFTPPWNRCSADTLAILRQLGYPAVSRSEGARPPAPAGLREFSVSVDLHTRKDPTAQAGWHRLLTAMETSLATGCSGLMIHHQRMNEAAFDYLDMLLSLLRETTGLEMVHFRDIIQGSDRSA